jgi:gamma-glutamyltranspeptidase/glutathione hydrolase
MKNSTINVSCLIFISLIGLAPNLAHAQRAAIASAQPLATEAGFKILAQGGNAFDAAVAVSAALAVVEPSSSGLGGGGFWLLHRQHDGFEVMLDGRETAPLAADKDMYLDGNGNVIDTLSKDGALAAAIPGMPAAIVHLAKKYGRLPLAQSLQPAIAYAQNGFVTGLRLHKLLTFREKVIAQHAEAAKIFLDNGKAPAVKFVLKQPDLAHTLQQIAQHGAAGFYQGEIGQKLVAGVKAAGGIWSQRDLDNYRVLERQPLYGNYHGIKITSAPSPSSGGIGLIEMLNILSAYDLNTANDATRKHLITEAMRRAYHDRALYLGDGDFTNLPVKQLLNPEYAAGLRSSIRLDKALPSQLLSGELTPAKVGTDTTHFSIIDAQGNRVAATLSINFPFGAGFVAQGTGVVLNNEMDDFVSKVGEMNGYGLVGSAANAIAPGKRMLSCMTPTFLEDASRIAVLGTPGGSRIISMVLLAVLDFAQQRPPQSWVKLPRFHHQYLPDLIEYEQDSLSPETMQTLTAFGHQLKPVSYPYGDMQAVEFNKQTQQFSAASDPRGEGLADVR